MNICLVNLEKKLSRNMDYLSEYLQIFLSDIPKLRAANHRISQIPGRNPVFNYYLIFVALREYLMEKYNNDKPIDGMLKF